MAPQGGRRILVIEDDEATRLFIVELLVDAGYEVRGACDGAEGLVFMSEGMPDLIIVDLLMPRMDGWAFRRRQRELDGFGTIPTIIVSGSEPPSSAELGSATFVGKPFTNEDLLQVIRMRLHPLST